MAHLVYDPAIEASADAFDRSHFLQTSIAWIVNFGHGWLMGDLLNEPVYFPKYAAYMLYLVLAFWGLMFVGPCCGLAVVALETSFDGLGAPMNWLHSRNPRVGVRGFDIFLRVFRVRVVRVRPSSRFSSRSFYPITVCDSCPIDDPLRPRVSAPYIVEIRRRNVLWRTITIWQVSMLDRGQKKIHSFQQRFGWTDGNAFSGGFEIPARNVSCFQSDGVIFAFFRYCDEDTLHVYDSRHYRSEFAWYPVSVWCLRRFVKEDGSVDGWRIRMLESRVGDRAPRYRMCLVNRVFESRRDVRLISQEEVVFGSFDSPPWTQHVRTTRGYFGVFARDKRTRVGPVTAFDPTRERYLNTRPDERVPRTTRKVLVYFRRPLSAGEVELSEWPVAWSSYEAVSCNRWGDVYRATLGVPTLKFLAANALLGAEQNRELRYRVNAEEFRKLAGVDGMDGHFG